MFVLAHGQQRRWGRQDCCSAHTLPVSHAWTTAQIKPKTASQAQTRTCEWVSAPLPSHHAWLPASQTASACHWSQCTDFPALPSSGRPVHTSPNWVRAFLCMLSCWETSPEPRSSFSHTLLSQSNGGDGARRGSGAELPPHLIPCQHKLPYGAYSHGRSPSKAPVAPTAAKAKCSGIRAVPPSSASVTQISAVLRKPGGRRGANKRQASLLVFIICIIIAPQCLVVDQNCILLALCKPRAKVLQSLPQWAYNLRFQTGGYKEMGVVVKGSSDKTLVTVTDSVGFLVRTISSSMLSWI